MSFPKIVAFVALVSLAVLGVAAIKKQKQKAPSESALSDGYAPIALQLDADEELPQKAAASMAPALSPALTSVLERRDATGLPSADRVEEFFNTGVAKLPIVETVTYSSRVPWLEGRPAWLVDYASHYATSRHFIARSLNKRPDYLTQQVHEGSKFNVLRKEKDLEFYLVIDVSRCKMWFYYLDKTAGQRVLVKDYQVGLGRPEPRSASGCLTPLGKYTLGPKVGIYKPGMMGTFGNHSTEMIRVFGSRWIPFEKEVEGCSAGARGYGIHGAPWVVDEKTGQLIESRGCIGNFESDGCIRLKTEDVEELFSIIITKPTTVDIVRDFYDAHPPYAETL